MPIVVRPFRAGDEAAFRDINLEWIERFFAVEAKDNEVLGDPHRYVLRDGGAILFACEGDEPVGVVSLIVIGDREVELAKMGVRFR